MHTFRPLENAFRVISWGRGIPSTTMSLMSLYGDLEHVDAIIHADAGWEHRLTYEIGDYYSTLFAKNRIYVVELKTGDIRREGALEHIHIPFWTETGGPLQRQCSVNFKIKPVRRHIRELMGYHPSNGPHPPTQSVEQWIGFTIDEVDRMSDSRVKYIANRWPLIEKRMTRADCINYILSKGHPLPVWSSCVGCPYKNAARWMETTTDEFAEAIEFDEFNRHNPLADRGNSTANQLYIYRHNTIPLANAPLEIDAKRNQKQNQLSLFPCGETCGV